MNTTLSDTSQKAKEELVKELTVKRRESRRAYKSHYGEAEECRYKHVRLGTVAIVCSVTAGSAFLAQATSIHPNLGFIASALTLVAAILTAMITFNRYDDRSAIHLLSARKWEQMRDDLEMMIIDASRIDSEESVEKIIIQYKEWQKKRLRILEESAPLPGHQFRKHENILDKNEI